MKYSAYMKSGHLVLPAPLFFHFKAIFQSSEDFLVWQFFFLQNTTAIEELAPSQIAEDLGWPLAEVNRAIANLQAQGLLELDMAEMTFDASPALVKLEQLLTPKVESAPPAATTDLKSLYADFERELGRLLSPFEIEEIQKLVQEDRTSPDLIRTALREAVFNGKANWKYIQAILRNWRREGITTPTQVQAKNAEREALHQEQVQPSADFLTAFKEWEI